MTRMATIEIKMLGGFEIRVNGKPVYYADDVDQIHVADPIVDELVAMSQRIEAQERRLEEQKEGRRGA